MIVVGRFALVCCLGFSLGAVALIALGVRRHSRHLMRTGYLAVYGLFFAAVVASSVLLAAFVARDFSFAYVAQNSLRACRSSTASPASGPASRARSCSGCSCCRSSRW